MIHLKDGLNTLHDNTCVKVYDPEIKKLIGVYPNYNKAGQMLGIISSAVQQRCTRKTRVYSPLYGKEVACRLSRKLPEDEPLMNKCKNNFL